MSKVLNVFYGIDLLPYKDKELQVHFPIVGQAFQGSSQTNAIKFYIDNIGDEDTTWVAVAKLPNGQIGFKQLSVSTDDNGTYAYLQLSNWFTQYKGDLYINLQGYDGGIEFVEDEETHILTPVGDPIIEVTGSVKLTIAYATQIVDGGEMEVHTLQEFWAALGTKLNKNSGHYFKVVDSIANINLSTYADYLVDEDVVFAIAQKNFYSISDTCGGLNATTIDLKLNNLVVDYLLQCNGLQTGTIVVPHPEDITFDATEQDLAEWVDEKLTVCVVVNSDTTQLSISNRDLLVSNKNVGIYDENRDLMFRYIAGSQQSSTYTYKLVDLTNISSNEMGVKNSSIVLNPTTRAITFNNNAIVITDTNVIYTKMDETTGHEVRISVDSNYDLKVELLNANNEVISSSDVDLPLESIVVSAQYYDTYEYQGTTYNQVIVITLATTSVPTIIPVGGLVNGLVDTTTFNNGLATKLNKQSGITAHTEVYAKTNNGSQAMISTDDENGTVVRRDTNGQIEVPSTPSGDTKSTSKGYVDTAITTGLASKQDTLVSGTNIKTINGTTLLGSGNYTFDTTFSEVSTNALENKVISREVREINYELAVIRESLFESVLTELDYEVEFATLYSIPDTLSDDDGTHRVVYSETELKEIEGNSFVYNQRVPENKKDFTNSTTDTRTNFQLSIQFYSTQLGYYTAKTENITTTGIKQYIVTAPNNYSDLFLKHNGLALDITFATITTPIISSHKYFISFDADSIDVNNVGGLVIKNIQVVDLTQSGLDSVTTVSEAISELAKRGIDVSVYNQYSTGEIRNSLVSGLKINGYNLLSLNRTLGTLSGGSASTLRTFDETKYYVGLNVINNYYPNFITSYSVSNDSVSITSNSGGYGIGFPIRVKAGQRIVLEYSPTESYRYISWYDENGKYLSYNDNAGSGVVAPSNAYWGVIIFRPSANTPKTYTNICVHFYGTRTGFAPYIAPTTISVPQTELLSAGSVHNNIQVVEGNVVEGEQLYNLVFNELADDVDLGTLNWTKISGKNNLFRARPTPYSKRPANSNTKINALCSKYEVKTFNQLYGEASGNGIGQPYDESYVYVEDVTYTDADTLKTAMNGVYLNYEKTTPTQTVIATDLHFDEVSSLIEQGGTIEMINSGTPTNTTTTFVVKKAVGE